MNLNPFSGGGGLPGLPSLPGLPNFGGGFPGFPGFPGISGMGGQQQGAPSGLGGTMQTSPYSDPNMGPGVGGNTGNGMDIQGILSMLMQGSQGMGGGQQGYIGGQGLI